MSIFIRTSIYVGSMLQQYSYILETIKHVSLTMYLPLQVHHIYTSSPYVGVMFNICNNNKGSNLQLTEYVDYQMSLAS